MVLYSWASRSFFLARLALLAANPPAADSAGPCKAGPTLAASGRECSPTSSQQSLILQAVGQVAGDRGAAARRREEDCSTVLQIDTTQMQMLLSQAVLFKSVSLLPGLSFLNFRL